LAWQASSRERSLALAWAATSAFRLHWALRRSLPSFAGHNGGGIPRDVTDEPFLLRVHHEGLVQTLRQLRFGKLLEGP
jgi:hypothetical protein